MNFAPSLIIVVFGFMALVATSAAILYITRLVMMRRSYTKRRKDTWLQRLSSRKDHPVPSVAPQTTS